SCQAGRNRGNVRKNSLLRGCPGRTSRRTTSIETTPWGNNASSATQPAVLELRIEFSSALSREIEDIPDRYQLVDAAFFDVARQPWMTGIRVMNRTVIVASEDGYGRILVSFFVFASEVVFEFARAGAQKTQS